MKKISLKNLNLKEVEQLSREQLKNVLGGDAGSGSTKPDPNPKITACNGKSEGAQCSWVYQGISYSGFCAKIAPQYILHCSDLI